MARLYIILDLFILLEVVYLIVSTKTGLALCRYLFENLIYKPEYKETVKNQILWPEGRSMTYKPARCSIPPRPEGRSILPVCNEEKKAANLIKRKAPKTRIIYSFLAVFGIIAGFCMYMTDPNYGLLLAIIGCAYMLAWIITKPDDGIKKKN